MCLLTLKEQILLHKKRVSFDKIKKGSESNHCLFLFGACMHVLFTSQEKEVANA